MKEEKVVSGQPRLIALSNMEGIERHLLDNQSVQSCRLGDLWRWSGFKVLLFPFTGDWVFMTEDEMN